MAEHRRELHSCKDDRPQPVRLQCKYSQRDGQGHINKRNSDRESPPQGPAERHDDKRGENAPS